MNLFFSLSAALILQLPFIPNIEPLPECPKVVEKAGWGGVENSGIQNKAYRISACDEAFVHLLDWENGSWTASLRHDSSLNVVGVDNGLCGINDYWHPEIVRDPRFSDENWQMQKCYELYKNGTRFYGADKGRSPNIIFHSR